MFWASIQYRSPESALFLIEGGQRQRGWGGIVAAEKIPPRPSAPTEPS